MTRRPLYALLAVAAGLGVLVLTWFLAFDVAVTRHADRATLGGFVGLKGPRVKPVATLLAHLGDPQPFVALGAALVGVALLRRRPLHAAATVLVLIGANVTTQTLKPALAQARSTGLAEIGDLGGSAWPSGHATASMSLALCAVLVASPARRPVVAALGAVFALAVSFSFLTLGWHFPSDVFAGFLVAATWTALGIAGVWRFAPARAGAQPTTGAAHALGPTVAAGAAAVMAAGVVALLRPEAVMTYARGHTAFVLGAAVVAALALALAAGFAVVLRR